MYAANNKKSYTIIYTEERFGLGVLNILNDIRTRSVFSRSILLITQLTEIILKLIPKRVH